MHVNFHRNTTLQPAQASQELPRAALNPALTGLPNKPARLPASRRAAGDRRSSFPRASPRTPLIMDSDDDLYDGDCGYDDEDEAMEGDDDGAGDGFYDDDDDCGHEEDPVRRERPLEFTVSNGERRSGHTSPSWSRSIDSCMHRSSLDPPYRAQQKT